MNGDTIPPISICSVTSLHRVPIGQVRAIVPKGRVAVWLRLDAETVHGTRTKSLTFFTTVRLLRANADLMSLYYAAYGNQLAGMLGEGEAVAPLKQLVQLLAPATDIRPSALPCSSMLSALGILTSAFEAGSGAMEIQLHTHTAQCWAAS